MLFRLWGAGSVQTYYYYNVRNDYLLCLWLELKHWIPDLSDGLMVAEVIRRRRLDFGYRTPGS